MKWKIGDLALGRLDELKASGRLEALMRSGLRHCENFAVIDAHAAGETQAVTVQRLGPDLVFVTLINLLMRQSRWQFDTNWCHAERMKAKFTPSRRLTLGQKSGDPRRPA